MAEYPLAEKCGIDVENSKKLIALFGDRVLQTIPQIPSLPIYGVSEDEDEDGGWGKDFPGERKYIAKLGDYLPASDIAEIDGLLAEVAESKGYTLLGGTTADLVVSVLIQEERVANYENNFSPMGDYCLSVRIYDRFMGARKNLYKDWFITKEEEEKVTEESVKRAKMQLGTVLRPDNLTYVILQAIEKKRNNSELKDAVPRILA